ncbi:MAG: Holliday junction resolvase RuvX [Sedimentisphaerales bacterium]|nr:Holliday junction resolvase RuvX [Sedimentisphaerales bacterium]
MRYLAIDHGTKRTGLAICDADERVASPLCVLQGRKGLALRIAQIVKAEDVGAVVVGLPVNMDDSEGPQAKMVRAFIDELGAHVNAPIHVQDERLSSFAAEEKLHASGLSRGRKRQVLDAIAAAEILQAFLERKSQQ